MALGSLLLGFATKYLSIREPLAIAVKYLIAIKRYCFNGSYRSIRKIDYLDVVHSSDGWVPSAKCD
ncbi:hypothetical protein NXC24_PB00136 (plasmid) [Rhizobium sp. NXC24]|nr:hypothetical protein NXC24_PB00136 [Rhizobium sp. NXC24]